MAYIRKAGPGGNSLGYTWEHAGAVVEVADEHVATLLATPYNDFTVVDGPEPEPEGESEGEQEPQAPAGSPDIAIEEPAPPAQLSEAPPARSRRSRGKNAESGDAASVEE